MNWLSVCTGVGGILFGFVVTIASIVFARSKYGKKISKGGKKKREASKTLAYWAAAIASASLFIPYILSAFDKQPVSEMTSYVFPACIGYLITYAGKSLGEKMSRNKHGLDENGNPFMEA